MSFSDDKFLFLSPCHLRLPTAGLVACPLQTLFSPPSIQRFGPHLSHPLRFLQNHPDGPDPCSSLDLRFSFRATLLSPSLRRPDHTPFILREIGYVDLWFRYMEMCTKTYSICIIYLGHGNLSTPTLSVVQWCLSIELRCSALLQDK